MFRAAQMCRDLRARNQKALKEYILRRQELHKRYIVAQRVKCEVDEAKYLRCKSAEYALKN